MHAPHSLPRRDRRGFSLLELMVVIAIMVLVATFIAPAVTSLKSAGDVSTAAYTIKGVLEQARSYAMANNTYTWVGFYEEDVSQPSTNPATPGNGRVVLSIVASKDGTTVYNNPGAIDPTRLSQIGKLAKIDNVHLPIFSDGSGAGDTFDTRPVPDASYDQACSCYSTRNSRFGDINLAVPSSAPSADSIFPFQYPVGNPAPAAQYIFKKILQFNPRGESSIAVKYPTYTAYTTLRLLEVGVLPTHGTLVPAPSPSVGNYSGNIVAVQLTGVGGRIKIYQR